MTSTKLLSERHEVDSGHSLRTLLLGASLFVGGCAQGNSGSKLQGENLPSGGAGFSQHDSTLRSSDITPSSLATNSLPASSLQNSAWQDVDRSLSYEQLLDLMSRTMDRAISTLDYLVVSEQAATENSSQQNSERRERIQRDFSDICTQLSRYAPSTDGAPPAGLKADLIKFETSLSVLGATLNPSQRAAFWDKTKTATSPGQDEQIAGSNLGTGLTQRAQRLGIAIQNEVSSYQDAARALAEKERLSGVASGIHIAAPFVPPSLSEVQAWEQQRRNSSASAQLGEPQTVKQPIGDPRKTPSDARAPAASLSAQSPAAAAQSKPPDENFAASLGKTALKAAAQEAGKELARKGIEALTSPSDVVPAIPSVGDAAANLASEAVEASPGFWGWMKLIGEKALELVEDVGPAL